MNERTDSIPRERDSEATRKALVEAATRLFARLGYEGCRNQQIADAAGTNKAMINYYFGGKLGLYRSAVTDAVAATRPQVEAFRSRLEDLEPAQRIGEWIRTLDRCFARQPNLPALLVREHLEGGSRLQEEFRDHISQFFLTTREVVESLAGNGDEMADGADAHAVHLSLIGALAFFLVSQPMRDEATRRGAQLAPSPERERYVAHLVRLFEGGLDNSTPTKGRSS